ncbi:MAG: competence protein ComEC [Thermoleophilaceae bacterium]|nr:competence protein ComEC [Thermoleophilaceae bacterium]
MEDPLVVATAWSQVEDVDERVRLARPVGHRLECGTALLSAARRSQHQLGSGRELLGVELRPYAETSVEKELEAPDGGAPATAGRESLWPLHGALTLPARRGVPGRSWRINPLKFDFSYADEQLSGRAGARRYDEKKGLGMRNSLFGLLVAVVTALVVAPAANAARGACLPDHPTPGITCQVWDAHIAVVDDGDTVQARLKQGNKYVARRSVRINGLQAMELQSYSRKKGRWGDCGSVEATERLEQLINKRKVRLSAQRASSVATGEGGRVRARRSIAVQRGGKWVDVGAIMIAEGHALWFPNGEEFASNGPYSRLAQEAAARKKNLYNPTRCGRGPSMNAEQLRLKIKWDADGVDSAKSNVNGEWIRITNPSANPVSLKGWWIRDSHFRGPRHGRTKGRGLMLPSNAVVPANGGLTVFVGKGPSSASTVFWGLGESIFGNATTDREQTGDGAYLFDPKGNMRAFAMYPCRFGSCTDPLAGKVDVTARYNGVEYEWIYVKNTSQAPISLHEYELESSPWFYEFGPKDIVLPGKSIVVWINKPTRTVPPRNGAPAIVPTRPGVLPFADTQPDGFRSWGHTDPLLSDNKDVVTLRGRGGEPVTCAAWGGEKCPNI